jgi:hypothetical protein
MNLFAQITKIHAFKREVHGILAEEAPDKSGEIFDYASSKPYVQEWSNDAAGKTLLAAQEVSFGNVRSQHNPKIVAGKLVAIDFDDNAKKIPVIARIVDDGEWEKVQQGVYTGFSIGGEYLKRWTDGKYIRYTAKPREVSIVDSPAMPGATFSMVKADGTTEQRLFHSTDLHALTARIAALARMVDERPRPVTPDTVEEALHKAVSTPLTSKEIEEQQSQSPRFVPREPRPCSSTDPWL